MNSIARARKLVIIVVILIVAIFASIYSVRILTTMSTTTSVTYTLPSGPYQPNVQLICPSGTYLADHRCVSKCPIDYLPVNMTNDLSIDSDSSPVCLDNGTPLSTNDLAGLQISDDNGSSVFLVLSNITMLKLNIMGQNYNTNIWLPVSKAAFDNITTVSNPPSFTTVIGTIGDSIDTFKILEINQSAVVGNVTSEYPVCCKHTIRVIHVGDDVGVGCLGISEVLKVIDYGQNIVVFEKVASTPPPSGCPIWTESTLTSQH